MSCFIRKTPISALPEEQVRQALLKRMVQELAFPSSMIALETKLNLIPQLSKNQNLPNRRSDILVFTNRADHSLVPLLIIECKAVPITQKSLSQVLGYNHFIQAPFIGIANREKFYLTWYNKKEKQYQYIDYLPCYQKLISSCFS